MDWKKIAIVISSLKHWWWAERVATILWTRLYEEWYDVTYLTFYTIQNAYDFKWKEFCLDEKLSNNIFFNIVKLFKRAYIIKDFCKKNAIDTSLSFMEESNFPNILSRLFFWNHSKIYVSIRQSTDFMSNFYRFLIKLLYKKADLIIPNSQEEAKNIFRSFWISTHKIKAIYNPLDLVKIEENKKTLITDYHNLFVHGIFTFITVGRLSYEKNQKFLIEAFHLFNQRYPNSQLLFLGDWTLRHTLEHLSQYTPNIHFLGNQNNVYPLLNASDCFLFSSLWEWFPNAVIEAMSCGLPIISTHFKTGISEILGHDTYWLLVNKATPHSFFEEMEKLYLDESLKNHYKQKSLERAKDFEISKIIQEWKTIL